MDEDVQTARRSLFMKAAANVYATKWQAHDVKTPANKKAQKISSGFEPSYDGASSYA